VCGRDYWRGGCEGKSLVACLKWFCGVLIVDPGNRKRQRPTAPAHPRCVSQTHGGVEFAILPGCDGQTMIPLVLVLTRTVALHWEMVLMLMLENGVTKRRSTLYKKLLVCM